MNEEMKRKRSKKEKKEKKKGKKKNKDKKHKKKSRRYDTSSDEDSDRYQKRNRTEEILKSGEIESESKGAAPPPKPEKVSAVDFFAKLRSSEKAKPEVGTIHAKGPELVDEVEEALKQSQKSDWTCWSLRGAGSVARYCETVNHRHCEKCKTCGAMRRWEVMRRAG